MSRVNVLPRRPATRFSVAGVVVLATALVLARPASPLTPVQRGFGELVGEAEEIVIATVESAWSHELPGGVIVTDVGLVVATRVKGSARAGSTIVLRMLGGKVGDVEMAIAGSPRLGLGETVLLFIRGNMRDIFPFVGVQRGVYRLRPDAGLGGIGVFDWQGRPVTAVSGNDVVVDETAGATALPLERFVAEIEARLPP